MNKKRFMIIIYVLIALVTVASLLAYLLIDGLRGTFVALGGVVIIVNLLLSLFFAHKNMK